MLAVIVPSGCQEARQAAFRPAPEIAETGGEQLSHVQYKVAAKELIRRRLRDPGSADFSGLEVHRVPGHSSVVCGLVSSRNGFGGMTGAQRFISGYQVIIEEGMAPGRMD